MSNILAVTYEDAVAVTKDDATADPAGPFAGFLCTAAGNVKVTTIRGTAVVIPSMTVGQLVPLAISRVWSTGTAGTVVGLVAMPIRKTVSS